MSNGCTIAIEIDKDKFEGDSHWPLFDLVDMKDELEALSGRKVDLLTRRRVEQSINPCRQRAILTSAETLDVV